MLQEQAIKSAPNFFTHHVKLLLGWGWAQIAQYSKTPSGQWLDDYLVIDFPWFISSIHIHHNVIAALVFSLVAGATERVLLANEQIKKTTTMLTPLYECKSPKARCGQEYWCQTLNPQFVLAWFASRGRKKTLVKPGYGFQIPISTHFCVFSGSIGRWVFIGYWSKVPGRVIFCKNSNDRFSG